MENRLAYLCSSNSWGGLEMNQLRNARWMKERGHTVFIFCKANSPIEEAAKAEGISVVTISGHKKYYDFKAGKLLAKALNEHQITHLILRDTRDMSVGVIAKRKSKTPIHLSYFLEMQLGVSKRNLLHTIRFKGLDVWSCPLNHLADQVRKLTRFDQSKLHVIPSGLNLEQFRSNITKNEARNILELPQDQKIIGLSGRFDPFKGHLLLLEALHKLNREDVSICFLGEPTRESGPEYVNQIMETIASYGLTNRVFIRPFRKDIEVFYKAIDYFVMASTAETFGMVTIEAMTSGLPVIASNSGGSPEILEFGKCGYLFEPRNTDSLKEKLEEALSKPDFPNAIDLQNSVEKYDYRKVCESVENALGLN